MRPYPIGNGTVSPRVPKEFAALTDALQLEGSNTDALLALDDAGLSPAARGFYAENRRVANGKAKRVFGWRPAFPDYRSGL